MIYPQRFIARIWRAPASGMAPEHYRLLEFHSKLWHDHHSIWESQFQISAGTDLFTVKKWFLCWRGCLHMGMLASWPPHLPEKCWMQLSNMHPRQMHFKRRKLRASGTIFQVWRGYKIQGSVVSPCAYPAVSIGYKKCLSQNWWETTVLNGHNLMAIKDSSLCSCFKWTYSFFDFCFISFH